MFLVTGDKCKSCDVPKLDFFFTIIFLSYKAVYHHQKIFVFFAIFDTINTNTALLPLKRQQKYVSGHYNYVSDHGAKFSVTLTEN